MEPGIGLQPELSDCLLNIPLLYWASQGDRGPTQAGVYERDWYAITRRPATT